MESCGIKWYISPTHQSENIELINQGPVVQRVDNGHNALHRINQNPAVSNVACFTNNFPLESDLSAG